jgi:uncharacterized circularly permuted ATP-grasp superfamily protein
VPKQVELSTGKAKLRSDHPTVVLATGMLAKAYFEAGQLAQARPFYEQVGG